MSLRLIAVGAVAVLVFGAFAVTVAGPMLQTDIDECRAAGGEQTTYGELLYCKYDNGTGRPLGTDETPHELSHEKLDTGPRGMAGLVPPVVAAFLVAVVIGVVQRFLP
jgi:hypothetical protein